MGQVPQIIHVTRRWLLSGLSASLAMVSSHGAANAEGGGGSDERPSSSHNIDKNPPKKRSKKISVIYTQKNLKNVKDRDLRTAIRGNKEGHSIVIEGFSKKMSSVIFEMMLVWRETTLTHFNHLTKLRTKKSRKRRLEHWLVLAEDRVSVLEHIARSQESIDPNNPELRRVKRMSELIRIWYRNPMEGALNKPQKKPAKKTPQKNTPKKSDTNAVTDFFTKLTGKEAPQNEEAAGSR